MNIYVVGWEYGSPEVAGGGFDWYFTKEDADKAYKAELINEADIGLDGWKAYQFTVAVYQALTSDAITEYIDRVFVDRVDAIKKNTPIKA